MTSLRVVSIIIIARTAFGTPLFLANTSRTGPAYIHAEAWL